MKKYWFIAPFILLMIGAIGVNTLSDSEIPSANSQIVDLSGKNLQEIPEDYKEQILRAEVLLLDDNNLKKMPEWLNEAKNLKSISINDNPSFDFFRFTVDFQEMTKIESLSAENCNIEFIPYQLTFFTKLQSLDLSGNKLKVIPFHLGFLTSLTECDFSENTISETGFSFRDLYHLKKLDLSGNENLELEELCVSLEGKILDELKLFVKDTLPQQISFVQTNSLALEMKNNLVLNEGLKTLSASELILEAADDGSKIDKNILNQVIANPSFSSLAFKDFIIPSVPLSLSSSKLKKIDISSSQLEDISNCKKMTSLNTLNIEENLLTLDQISDLKEALPSCNIRSDEEKLSGKNVSYSVTPPVKDLLVEEEKKIIYPDKKNAFISSTGETKLDIPANAFLNEKGKVVNGPVEIRFREFNDPLSIALSGIPMQVKNDDGSTGNFSSAGMFEFNAYSNGEKLYPNPNALITASIESDKTIPYDLYKFTEGTGWELVQPEPIIPVNNDSVTIDITQNAEAIPNYFTEDNILDTGWTKRKILGQQKIGLKVKRKNSEQKFYLNFDFLEMNHFGKRRRNFDVITVPFDEDLKYVLSKQFVYNGFNYDEDVKMLDSFQRELRRTYHRKGSYTNYRSKGKRFTNYAYDENVLLKDIRIRPNAKTDDYILQFNYKGRIIKMNVILANEGVAAKTVQDRNRKFYQNYLFASEKQVKNEEEAKEKYKEYYETNFARIEEARKKMRGLSEEQRKQMAESVNRTVYSFTLQNFGIINCDIVARMKEPKPVRAAFKDVLGKTLIFLKMIRIDKISRSVSFISPVEDPIIDFGHDQTALILIMENGELGMVSAEELAKHRNNSSIRVKVVDPKLNEMGKVRAML